MTPDARQVAASQAYCRHVTRQANSSFPLAFRVLPAAKRDAMTALYAYLRVTDDLADEPGDPAAKRVALADWRAGLAAALDAGRHTHPVHAALAAAVRRHGIPPGCLFDVVDGVEMDLEPVAFATFAELAPYCHRVASAVGLACVPVWGGRPGYEPAAAAAGVAFQLTNILRDVAEDAARGRVYLPHADLARFGLTPATWLAPPNRPAFKALLHYQAARAQDYYDRAADLDGYLTRDGRAIYGAMVRLYRGLLDRITAADYDVLSARVRVGPAAKLAAVARAWPVKWGLL